MTNYELYSLIIAVLTLIVAICGIVMTLRQLKITREMTLLQLQENYNMKVKEYEWNKSAYAQQKLAEFNQLDISVLQSNDKLNFITNNDVLPLELIWEEMSKNLQLRIDIHTVLNFYESLARGIKLGIYDEEIIQAAREGGMRRMVKSYRKYIEFRRDVEQHPNAWLYLTDLVDKWEAKSKQPVITKTHF